MQFKVSRSCITIFSETEQDLAFVEDTLGLKRPGDFVKATRRGDHIYIEQEQIPFQQMPGGMPQGMMPGGMPQGMMPPGMPPGAQIPQTGMLREFPGQQPQFPRGKTPPQIAQSKPEKEGEDK